MEDLLELARDLRSSGMELEDVLAELRDHGASITDSLKIARDLEHMSLGQAKSIVDASPTWADARSFNRELRDAVVEALDEIES